MGTCWATVVESGVLSSSFAVVFMLTWLRRVALRQQVVQDEVCWSRLENRRSNRMVRGQGVGRAATRSSSPKFLQLRYWRGGSAQPPPLLVLRLRTVHVASQTAARELRSIRCLRQTVRPRGILAQDTLELRGRKRSVFLPQRYSSGSSKKLNCALSEVSLRTSDLMDFALSRRTNVVTQHAIVSEGNASS